MAGFQDDGGLLSPVGPLVGTRRPRYDVLNEELGRFIASNCPKGSDLTFFINIGHALRQFFSAYTTQRLSEYELRHHPRVLAGELINLAAHYRHYAWSRFGVHTTVALYHSTKRCPQRLAALEGYKSTYYSKRVDPNPPGEYAMVRKYVDQNVEMARLFCRRVPSVYVVDTGELDAEAWPWAMMATDQVRGPAVVVSGWESDAQYALAPDLIPEMAMRPVVVLRASGERTVLVGRETAVDFLLRKSKTADDLAQGLSPSHALYLIAMSGEADLGVDGVPKVGAAKAAKMIQDAVRSGRLPGGSPSLEALQEETGIRSDELAGSWRCLVHRDYAREFATPSVMSSIEQQLVDLSGLGELEKVNNEYFADAPVNLGMLMAGEEW